jgi:hypothetical protein
MYRTPNRVPRRGSSVIKKIVIKGFESPLIVENGKHIKNWTEGLRERVMQEASNLTKVAKQSVQQSLSLASNAFSEAFPEIEESDNQLATWEWFSRDGETSNMETDTFIEMNDDSWLSRFE